MTWLKDKNQSAIAEIARWVSTLPRAQLLQAEQLKQFGRGHWHSGWSIPINDGGSLVLLLDEAFPYSVPRLVLIDRPDLLAGPHVEADGFLCLTGPTARVDSLNPVSVIEHSYQEALALLSQNGQGGNQNDFDIDFEAYWKREASDAKLYPITGLLKPQGPSRIVASWSGAKFEFVAETEEDCLRWLANRYGGDEGRRTGKSALLFLKSLPSPSHYPKTLSQLRQLLRDNSDNGLNVFDELIVSSTNATSIVLLGLNRNGAEKFGALFIYPPVAETGKGKPRDPIEKGFRIGHVPAQILALRYRMAPAPFERVDSARSRLRPEVVESLSNKKVAIIGCGSLGSGIAKLLLQSGISQMWFADPDKLDWTNIGRHELGAESVGHYKAEALAARFKKAFPHVRDFTFSNTDWRTAYTANPSIFESCDLILSLTGDWNSESALSDLHRSGEIHCPIIYGWLEERAAATHSLLLAPGDCLRCGFDHTGNILTTATCWPKTTAEDCGGIASVYGAAELLPGQALVAELALDVLTGIATPPLRRVWLTNEHSLSSQGGWWNQKWIDTFGDPQPGGKIVVANWPQDA